MHESIFSAAAYAEGATVLRLALRPYSIGHEILLWRTSNPFATYGRKSIMELPEGVQRQKLFTACFICERSWEQNHTPFKWPLLTLFCRRDCVTAVEVDKFLSYRDSASQDFPAVKQPPVKGASYHYFGAPDLARLVLFMCRGRLYEQLGFQTPWDAPLGLARQLYSTYLEEEQLIWIENYQDVEFKERAEAYDKANPEPQLAVGEEAVQRFVEEWEKAHPGKKPPSPVDLKAK